MSYTTLHLYTCAPKWQQSGTCQLIQVSTLNFVDLAGSERSTLAAKEDGDNKLRQTEGSAINKSLLTLGNVIRGLGDGRVSKCMQIRLRNEHVVSDHCIFILAWSQSARPSAYSLMLYCQRYCSTLILSNTGGASQAYCPATIYWGE